MTSPPVMSMTLAEAQEYFGVLGALMDECRLKITETGWDIKAVDPANVAMVVLEYPFSVLPAKPIIMDGSFPVDVGLVNIDMLLRTLKVHDEYPSEKVEFSFRYGEEYYGISPTNHKVKLIMKIGCITETIVIPYISEFRKVPILPTIDLPSTVHLRTEEFKKVLACAGVLNDYIELGVVMGVEQEDGHPLFYCHADGGTKVLDVRASDNSTLCRGIWDTSSTKSAHSLDYLEGMVKAIKDPLFTMQLGIDYPVILKFRVCGKGKGEYLLAPRVDSK